jgi:outer membrane protein OmpA-like peptidoglycan-associated protein
MRFHKSAVSGLVTFWLLALVLSAPVVLGQQSQRDTRTTRTQDARTQDQDTNFRPFVNNVGLGQKAKIKGMIVKREADTFTVLDDRNVETTVLLTDSTSVKSKGWFLRPGKNYAVTELLRGLMVDVEGRGDQSGQLVANKVRFDSSDLKFARVVDRRVSPVELANERLSGQVDELGEVSRLARGEADRAHERISSLDDYDVQESATVLFRVNSAMITPDDRAALDELARKAMATRGYVIEIAGFADSTGNVARNRLLSQRRADAVVRYLQENHDIPLRRMITPFGYGELRPVADNTTADGRRQNRRVEVKLLVSRGIASNQ